MVTLNDVAKHASVSPSTVSIVVNNRNVRGVSISPATRERVLESARQLGYTPNSLARAVATGKNRVFAYITDNPTAEISLRTMIGAQEEADNHDYMIKPFRWPKAPELWTSAITKIMGQRIAGAVLISIEADSLTFLVEEFSRRQLPFVQIDDCQTESVGTSVISDDESGIREVVNAMIEMGHRDFGYIGGPKDSRIAAERKRYARIAIQNQGLTVHDEWIVDGSWEDSSVVRPLVKRIIGNASSRPSVLVCASDWTAMMALRAIREAGLSVPTNISVTGFADFAGSYLADPSLTTVRQPFEQMGSIAVRQLMAAGEMPTSHMPTVHKVPTKLILRESTGHGPLKQA